MPAFTNPTSRPDLPKFSEASQQRSRRDSDSIERQWKKHAQTSAQQLMLTENVRQLQRQLDRMRRRRGGGEGGDRIRMLVCNPLTNTSSYYLVDAILDPDQTP